MFYLVMRVVEALKGIPSSLSYPVIAIGVFDGVHRGHQRILKKLVSEARRLKTKALVITFFPHPRKVLNPGVKGA